MGYSEWANALKNQNNSANTPASSGYKQWADNLRAQGAAISASQQQLKAQAISALPDYNSLKDTVKSFANDKNQRTIIPSVNYDDEYAKSVGAVKITPDLQEKLYLDSAKKKQINGEQLNVAEIGALMKFDMETGDSKAPENRSQAYLFSKEKNTENLANIEKAIRSSDDFGAYYQKGFNLNIGSEDNKDSSGFLEKFISDYSVKTEKNKSGITDGKLYNQIKNYEGIYKYLTLPEREIYYYLAGKGDNKMIHEYINTKKPELESRMAEAVAIENENSGFFGGVKNTVNAAEAGLESGLMDMARLGITTQYMTGLSVDPKLNKVFDSTYKEKLYSKISQRAYDKNVVYGLWLDIVNNTAAQVPEAIYGFAGGQGAYIGGLAMKMLGNTTTEALNQGQEISKGFLKGLVLTGLEVAPDFIFGGMSTLFDGDGVAKSKLTSRAIKAIDDTISNEKVAKLFAKAVTVTTAQFGEGLEEFAQEFAEPIVNNIIYNQNEKINSETFTNALKSFIIGFFSTTANAIGGANANINDAYKDIIGGEIKNLAGVKSVLDFAEVSENKSDLYYEVKGDYESGRNVSNPKVADLYYESANKFALTSPKMLEAVSEKNVDALIKLAKEYTENKHKNAEQTAQAEADSVINQNTQTETLTEAEQQLINTPDTAENNSQNSSGEVDNTTSFDGIDTATGKHLNKAQQEELQAIGEKLGRKVVYEDFYRLDKFKGKKKIPDGYIDKDGNIHINFYAKRPVYFIFKHEITHYLKRVLPAYTDFMDMAFNSKAFSIWLHSKGYSSINELKAEIMDTYSEVKGFDEAKCYDEILADFVGGRLFGGERAINAELMNALEPKHRKTFLDVIKDIIDYFKSKFSEEAKIKFEINQIEKEFIKVYNQAVNIRESSNVDGEQYSFMGYAEDGKGKYKSNFPKGTPKFAKGEKILKYIQDVWSKKPIRLRIDENGNTRYIEAKFDPTYDESGNTQTDASKLMGGNRHGTSSEQRVTLDLADDYYQIASESQYNYSKDETGKDNPAHKDVTKWHYFINDIYFAEYGSEEYEPYRVSINVKEKPDGEYVYSFSAEKQRESNTPRTLHAVVNEGKNPDANVELSNNRVAQKPPTVKKNSMQETDDYSIPANISAESLLEQYENGEITRQEYLDMVKKQKPLNPAEIANLTEEDANTTPHHSRKKGESDGDKESKFYGSLLESDIFDERFKDEARDDSFIQKYKSVTNKETLEKAAKELDEGGQSYVNRWWNKDPEHASLIDTAVGFILMDRYQRVGDYESATAAAERVRAFGTAGGQQVQIFSILGRLDPNSMVLYAQKQLDKAFEELAEIKTKKWIDKNADKLKLTEDDIELIRRYTLQAALFDDNTRPKAIALGKICNIIQDKIPPEAGQSIRALQRSNMLLNLKTILRNINGNVGMTPLFIASDFFGTAIDKAVSKKTEYRSTGMYGHVFTKDGRERLKESTKSFGKGVYESWDDFKRGIRTKQEDLNRFELNASTGKNFNEHHNGKLAKQLDAIAKALNKMDNFTSFCLEVGDRPFFEMWMTNSLNNQLRLNNLEIPTPEMIEVAKQEALQRTWQDDNKLTRSASKIKSALNDMVHIPGTSYGLGDFVMKFIKTPSNIAKAIGSFSPVGFVSAGVNAKKLKNAIDKGKFNPQLQREFVRSMSNAITGTTIYALVAIGAALGVVKLSGDDDDDKDASNYEKYIMGIPPYSIEFFGVNVTYDWAQPFGSILAVVADFMESQEENPDGDVANAIVEAIKAGGKAFSQQSFLQSLYDLFSSEDIVEALTTAALAEPAAFVPQRWSQTASYFDEYRRTSYDNTNSFKSAVNKVIAKIPGLRTTLPKQVNVLGEDVKNTQYLDEWEAFASPWNTYPKSSGEVVGEIYKLYKSTGENSVIPRTAPNYFTVKGNKIIFTPEEKADFQRNTGKYSAELLGQLFDSQEYTKLSDDEKATVISKIYQFAYDKVKSERKYDYDTLSAMVGKKKNGEPILTKSVYSKLREQDLEELAQEYFLSRAEMRYINDYEKLIQYYINQAKN